ncbi:hypothetical protein V8E52_004671 [Russula decolorans]
MISIVYVTCSPVSPVTAWDHPSELPVHETRYRDDQCSAPPFSQQRRQHTGPDVYMPGPALYPSYTSYRPRSPPTRPLGSNYTCKWATCGLPQTSRFALMSHIRSHTGEKPFTCKFPECDKSFTRSDALAKHMHLQHNVEGGVTAPGGNPQAESQP